VRVSLERLVGLPDATPCSPDIQPTLALAAGRFERHRTDTSRGDVVTAVEQEHVKHTWVGGLVERSNGRPLTYRLPALLERLECRLRAELRVRRDLVCRLLLEKKKLKSNQPLTIYSLH